MRDRIYKVIEKGSNKHKLPVKLVKRNELYNVIDVCENYQLGRMIKSSILQFKQDTDLNTATIHYNKLKVN